MSHAKRALIVSAVLIVAGCASGGSGSPGGTPIEAVSVSRDAYAAKLAAWLCDDLATCCATAQQSFDRDGCVAVKQKAELHRLASEEAHSGRVFSAAMAAICVARLGETPTDCGSERRVKECFQTYEGSAELGAACGGNGCRGSATGDVACIAGVCTTRLATGEACVDLPDDVERCKVCRPDARCREAVDGNHYCYAYEHRRGVAGDPCQKDQSVQPVDPTKVLVLADCRPEDGLYCSGDGVCAPFVPIGGTCTSSYDCEAGARCGAGHVCAPGSTVGEACAGAPSHECAAGLYCHATGYTCTSRDPVTQACLAYDVKASGCAVPSGEGGPCDRFTNCADGLLCSSLTSDAGGQCVAQQSLCTMGLEHLARQASKVN